MKVLPKESTNGTLSDEPASPFTQPFSIEQWFPTFFYAFLPLLILELFIPPLLHQFSRVAERVKTPFLR